MMSKEERHLQTKIRLFEDMILRAKNSWDVEKISIELTKMRQQLQKLQYKRTGGK